VRRRGSLQDRTDEQAMRSIRLIRRHLMARYAAADPFTFVSPEVAGAVA
jgi:hypothetical protein